MKWQKRSLPPATLTAGTETPIDVPRDYFLQKMLLKVDITYNTAASVTKTKTIFQQVSEVRIEREGKRSDIPFRLSGDYIRALGKYDYMKEPPMTDFSTTTNQTGLVATCYLPIDFRIDKWNDRDASALVDLFNYSAVKLMVKMGSADTGYTWTALTCRVTMFEAVPEASEKSLAVYNHVLVYANFGTIANDQACDLRTGGFYKRIALITTTDTAITDFLMQQGTLNLLPKTNFPSEQQTDLFEYSPPTLETGWAWHDFAEINGVDNALDLTKAKSGDVKLYIIPSSSNASVIVLYDLLEK